MGEELIQRRAFIRKTLTGAAVAGLGGILPGFSAQSYGNILGANDRIRVTCMGVNSRGFAVADNFAGLPNCEVLYVSDVDRRAAEKCIASVGKIQKKQPKARPDFRKALEDKNVDALVVTAPDHWHVPAALLACQAGKHVYLEKPASHNPREGELVVEAAKKYNRVIQLGNQRRSWPNVAAAIKELHGGAIGRPYFVKTWYANNRPSIGIGKETAVPEWLDYELWQGPAPRRAFRDNVVHYNWHWFWHWGTAESGNTGMHQIDLARWGLGVDYPTRVTSAGGRYRYQDDQETPDTQVITLEFKNNTSILYEGRSCNGKSVDGSGTALIFYGDNGSMLIDGNAYTIYDPKNKVVKEVKNQVKMESLNTTSPAQQLDAPHMQNFLDGIRTGTKLISDILGGHQSTLLCQLGNIALRTGYTLNINPENGHILNNPEAMKFWAREYQPGWEPKV
ncbi:dehydrogenase [Adhaeribacter aerolatus]|uniref:Dehydrogenase n=1 Tax=Adhaeribacter aerolatus TaxID=670289 RepID=A0A512B2F4_9BACT|nr:Gfo/Idh/MocA family oxidoreductase [Adhaeribacter aerolatus]GEO06145.1 dehydrogenase [Adhaeribacter aerolatus]